MEPATQSGRPLVDDELAAEHARLWGLEGRVVEFGCYDGRNFSITCADGRRFSLKYSGAEEPREVIDLQHRALRHLAARPSGAIVPRVVPSASGADVIAVHDRRGQPTFVRALSWIEGEMWADLIDPSAEQLATLGRVLAELVRDLEGFEHPAIARRFRWNPSQAHWIKDELHIFRGHEAHMSLVTETAQDIEERFLPRFSDLKWQAIHSDANEHNLLQRGGAIVGIIDFADVCWAPRICDLANALAYAAMKRASPEATVDVCTVICESFHRSLPLTPLEIDLLFDLIRSRLAVSVTASTIEQARDPDNAHITITQREGWDLLEMLSKIGRSAFTAAITRACSTT